MGGMTGSLLLLLWAGVSVSTTVDLQKRIIGGHDCNDTERLYHVKLIIHNNTEFKFCGGSLISDEWILTAAHCWEPGWTMTAVLGVHPGHKRVFMEISSYSIHEHDDADIMLLNLTKTGFDHIDLPDCEKFPLPKNEMVQIAGHGATTAGPGGTRNPRLVEHLKCTKIKAVECEDEPYEELFCGETTDRNNKVGVCDYDSGGGVVYDGKIYGVISGATDTAHTGPDFYEGVCGHIDWIRNTTKLN